MNYIIFGALVIAGFIIIGLGIRLVMTRRRIKQNKRPKKTLADLDKEIMETTSELIKDLPPVNGPDPVVTDADYDNPYSNPNKEPFEIAEKDELESAAESLGICDEHGKILTEKNDPLAVKGGEDNETDNVSDEILTKVAKVVSALEPVKTRKITVRKKTTKKTTKKVGKKPAKKTTKKFAPKVEEVVKPKRKYTKKAKVTE